MREIDCAVRAIVDDAFDHARRVLDRNRAVLQEGAGLLLAAETLDDAQLQGLFERVEREAADPTTPTSPPSWNPMSKGHLEQCCDLRTRTR